MDKIAAKVCAHTKDNDKILVAVSGGVDSMVLLHALLQAKKEKNLFLRVVTVEHGIRKEDSVKDAQFVKNFCDKNGIDCEIVKLDVPKLAKQNKQTLEECARNERYKILFAKLKRGEKLFVAHNKNDQAETVLMHIARGSGIDGARGIAPRENVARPLIDVTKKEIYNYAEKHNVKFVVDQTNDCTDYSRNYVRKEIIPAFEKIYPNFVSNLAKFADYCKKSEEFISKNIKNSWFSAKNNQILLKNSAFIQNQLVVAKAIKIAYNKLGEYSDLESKHIDIVVDLQQKTENGLLVNLPHGVVAEKRTDGIYFYKSIGSQKKEQKFCVGENNAFGTKIVINIVSSKDIDYASGKFYCDLDKIPSGAVWRTRKQNDKFKKLGSSGHKKLSDYFTDKKMTKNERDTQILLAIGNEILFVVGKDLSDNIKIDNSTKNICKFEI